MPQLTGIRPDFADLEREVLDAEIERRQLYWAPEFAARSAERPWSQPLSRRKREAIATAIRDAVEILRSSDDRDPLILIDLLLWNAICIDFVPNDLADTNICLALATTTTTTQPNKNVWLPFTARVLARAARFARMPALPCPWGVSVRDFRPLPRADVTTGRLSSRRPNLQSYPRSRK